MIGHLLISFENGERYWVKIENIVNNIQIKPHITQIFSIKSDKKTTKGKSFKDFIYIFCKRCGHSSLKFFSNGKQKCMNPACSIEIRKIV